MRMQQTIHGKPLPPNAWMVAKRRKLFKKQSLEESKAWRKEYKRKKNESERAEKAKI